MLNITDLKAEQRKVPLFRLAFRPFFLFGCLFSIFSLIIWGSFLSNPAINMQPYGGWFWWHGHEMLFGFVCSIIVGFLLTAVQNWSGLPGISGWPLAGLFALWATGRLLMITPVLPPIVIAVVDSLFLPAAAAVLAHPVITTKLWRNLVFVPLLLLLALVNATTHYQLINGSNFSLPWTQSAILIIALIMSVLGGRVIPFFTANATRTEKPQPLVWLEVLAIGSVVIPLFYSLGSGDIGTNKLVGGCFILATVSHTLRFARWQCWLTLNNPLLWSLHLAYLFIIVGFALLASYHLGFNITLTTALHGITVGGMGLLILSMISRVSLGHTGRMLIVSQWIVGAYVALAIAAVVRLVAPLATGYTTHMYLLSIAAWVAGYLIYAVVYWPVLTQPRLDGRPG
ncbi:MAG: NnrS family protein [Pseudomonadales bacterium]|nr:NnrS family protein [Pseudomonadales bacterium]MCP5170887.1 NnrS family protein [Pseudomonadales bacterium]MCP5301873.1 NnrS family protein [Pseudomonadales bacterium]